MPWIRYRKPPGEIPAHYEMPMIISDRTGCLEDARGKRKYWQQHHDHMAACQKLCGRQDIEGAKFFKEEAAEAMKHLRGWKFTVDILECYYGGKGQKEYEEAMQIMTEHIAPYADQALGFVCDTANPCYGE